jgi:hypothetical protein
LLHNAMNSQAALALRQKYVALADGGSGDRGDYNGVVFNNVGSHARALSAEADPMTPAQKFFAKGSKSARIALGKRVNLAHGE